MYPYDPGKALNPFAIPSLRRDRRRESPPAVPCICLTCGVSVGPLTPSQIETERENGHNIIPDPIPEKR